MKCPYCSKPGLKKLKGYCCKAHRRLHKRPPHKTIPCSGCGSPQRRLESEIAKSGQAYCKRCKRPKGESHYKFNGGSYVDPAGYRWVLTDKGYIKEHRIEWQRANKACLLERGTIHHIRFDIPNNKIYNDPDNLVLLDDRSHGSFHRLYEAERYEESYQILITAACAQLYYPHELDKFMLLKTSNGFSC